MVEGLLQSAGPVRLAKIVSVKSINVYLYRAKVKNFAKNTIFYLCYSYGKWNSRYFRFLYRCILLNYIIYRIQMTKNDYQFFIYQFIIYMLFAYLLPSVGNDMMDFAETFFGNRTEPVDCRMQKTPNLQIVECRRPQTVSNWTKFFYFGSIGKRAHFAK